MRIEFLCPFSNKLLLASDHRPHHTPEGTIGRTAYHDGNIRWKPGGFSAFSHQG